MFRAKLLKAIALGLCMSVLYTGAAYAQSTGGSTPAFEGTVDAEGPLFDKQKEIDQILFVDMSKDIEAKGIKVVYTGVAGDNVEIGVASLTDEQADYLYGILGKDQVKLVPAEEAQIYTTMAVDPAQAPDAVPSDSADAPVTDKAELYKDMPANATDGDGRVYKGSDAVATDDVAVTDDAATDLENPDVIFYTTANGAAEPGQEAELVYATGENAEAVKTGAEADKDGMSTPVIILLVAGGALVIGGGAVVLGKKRK